MAAFLSRVYGKRSPDGRQKNPPPGNHLAEDERLKREQKIREAMTIGFQRRRLPGEEQGWK